MLLLTKELGADVVGPREPIQWADVPFAIEPLRARVERAMRDVAGKAGPSVAPFPDTVLLGVMGASGNDLVYTIARNRSHTSVEFTFSEGVELEPAEDTLQIVSGIASSRPNLFLVVNESELDPFVEAWKALKPGDGSWSAFVARWGARRSDPQFWSTFDFFATMSRAVDPIGAAVLDLSRYVND
jgi:fatty acid cis/trans isomerase CTI